MKEEWCQAKSTDNQGMDTLKWTKCQKCCVHCSEKDCELRVCDHMKTKEQLCCWKASPAEWMMGRLDKRSAKFTFRRRLHEFRIRVGYRPDDGSWEGERLKEWSKKYPKVYKEMVKEFVHPKTS